MSQLVPDAAAAEPKGTVKIRIDGLKKSFGDLLVLDDFDLTDRKVDLDRVRQHFGMVSSASSSSRT